MSQHYNDDDFWETIKRFGRSAGRSVLEPALKMYYAALDADTPVWAKTVMISALGYFIMPVDAVPDFLPGGLVDDMGTLAGALTVVAAHIKEEHGNRAREVLAEWFGM